MVLRSLLRFYKLTLSPLLGNRCRFYPSCSEYCVQAVEGHGVFVGGWLAFKRVIKCHPFHPGGEDPVPPRLKAD
jgi:putative membrane protein insertion efficiency factor